MAEPLNRFDHVRRSAKLGRLLSFIAVVSLVVVAGYLLGVESETIAGEGGAGFRQVMLGVCLLAAGLLAAAALSFVWNLVDLALKVEANSHRMLDLMRDVAATTDDYRRNIRMLTDNSQLSDMARAITHRDKERTALRLAINEETIRGDWEAAYALVELLESRHGYKNEAARLREEVDESRERARSDQLQEAVERARAFMSKHDWDRARRAMDRLIAAHPDNQEVRGLPATFKQMRGEHKRRLLKAWDEAVQRNEVDRGIAILKELDQFLTPSEAGALEESARGVFRARLQNLAVQFSLAVTDHEWRQALAVGKQIIEEFPNSRMAQEVKERIHLLEMHAEEESAAKASK